MIVNNFPNKQLIYKLQDSERFPHPALKQMTYKLEDSEHFPQPTLQHMT